MRLIRLTQTKTIVLVLLFIVIGNILYYFYLGRKHTQEEQNKAALIQKYMAPTITSGLSSPIPSPTPTGQSILTIQEMKEQSKITKTIQNNSQDHPIQQKIPISWKAQFYVLENSKDGDGNLRIARIEYNIPFGVFGGSVIVIDDVTDWVKNDGMGSGDSEIPISAAEKNRFVNYLIHYGDPKYTIAKYSVQGGNNSYDLFRDCKGLFQKKIATDNNQLSGVTSIGFSTQVPQDAPFANFCMAGWSHDRLFLLRGGIQFVDQQTRELYKFVEETPGNYSDTRNYQKRLPADTSEMWNELQEMIKSTKIDM